ncbi:hypothetical protein B0T10DRAFT_132214 [Thelonectria olida]|uniref:U6 snRNA phosphodiesterase n=1 Tax=Thelonectria olida TaxID=1576542 RepID=A0A9P9AM98_9HYPO|nr:hypothetical protein B0T10DRAFT_132214 [Thelonectria olida]
MALVDYSSSDSAEDDRQPPPSKRRKAHSSDLVHSEVADGGSSGTDARSKNAATGVSDMPPLPTEFHDLYASTVRQSVVDDPTLHHGRRRQTPHVVGNWPTHLYVEWYPTAMQHRLLCDLLDDIQAHLDEVELHNFLISDLGAPLPLHISLSRPLSLPTHDKDTFLEKITHTLRASTVHAFTVRPQALFWFRSPDSNRTFLVLRVGSNLEDEKNLNPELLGLLTRCNEIAKAFSLPALYQKGQTELVGNAFHISIGWTFDHPSDSTSMETLKLLNQAKFEPIRAWEIDVAGVKAKIGNVVNHIALDRLGRGGAESRLFES